MYLFCATVEHPFILSSLLYTTIMKIAVEGCCHDELEVIYNTIQHIEAQKGIKIDLLLICGDFEATRNPDDLQCMAVPQKYKRMEYFYK